MSVLLETRDQLRERPRHDGVTLVETELLDDDLAVLIRAREERAVERLAAKLENVLEELERLVELENPNAQAADRRVEVGPLGVDRPHVDAGPPSA